MRPILLVPAWVFLLLGYFQAGGRRFFTSVHFLHVLVGFSLLLAALYVFNQLFDMASDAINKKHLLISESSMPRKNAYALGGILIGGAALAAVYLEPLIRLFFGLSLLLGIAYSLPPVRLKARPFADVAVNAIGYGFINFSLGWLTVQQFSAALVLNAVPYMLAVGAIFVNTTVLDLAGDRECGYRTTGVFLGTKRALALSTALMGACLAAAAGLRNFACLVPAIVALPLFVAAALKRDTGSIARSVRVSGPLLVLVTGMIFPYFLILFLAVFVFLRVYYRRRFGIDYPAINAGLANR